MICFEFSDLGYFCVVCDKVELLVFYLFFESFLLFLGMEVGGENAIIG